MEKSIKDFLEFNGHPMFFTLVDGVWWIAIKPICEALEVDYIRQFKNLKDDDIFSELLSKQTIVAADNKTRKMVCLPEKYTYAWLLSIKSASPGLREYKLKCYDIIYDYFHGVITKRQQVLKEKTTLQFQIDQIEEDLKKNTQFQEWIELKTEQRKKTAALRHLDADLISNQLELWRMDYEG